ncbi:MAG: hypothetical protein ABJH98_10570 [Reichenbachiella sp.]|uniref:hypothetical protein n=1 Tax=Reichenbachiella sp. TaxID=2184521 RepID=UPI0032984EC8
MTNTNFFKNGRALRILVLYIGVFASIWACEEEVDPTVSDPSVGVFFLNQTRLTKVDFKVDSLDEELEVYDSIISSLETSADDLVDRLIDLTDSLADGFDLEQDSIDVVHDLDTLNRFLTDVEMEDSVVNAIRSLWADTAATINSGAVKVESIVNTKNMIPIFYEDSSTSWKLPLDMQADDIDVDITIEGSKTFNLKLSYSRTTTANEKNKVVIKTSNFEIISTDFNNSSLSCENCDDINTMIYVEF